MGKILNYLEEHKNRKEPIYSKYIQKKFIIERNTALQHLPTLERLDLIKRESRGILKAISITKFGESFIPS